MGAFGVMAAFLFGSALMVGLFELSSSSDSDDDYDDGIDNSDDEAVSGGDPIETVVDDTSDSDDLAVNEPTAVLAEPELPFADPVAVLDDPELPFADPVAVFDESEAELVAPTEDAGGPVAEVAEEVIVSVSALDSTGTGECYDGEDGDPTVGLASQYTCAEVKGTMSDDVLVVEGDLNFVHGVAGNDTVFGGGNNDEFYGDSGDDILYGEGGDDELYGNSGNDQFNGGTGADRLFGGEGDDRLFGGSGDDNLLGNSDNDIILGGLGHDTIFGSQGNDVIYGVDIDLAQHKLMDDGEMDYLNGGSGDDWIVAGAGDMVSLGEGNDVVVFGDQMASGQISEVMGFRASEDRILVIYDAADDQSEPSVEFKESDDGAGKYELLIDGVTVSLIHSYAPPSVDDVSFIDQASLVDKVA